MCAVYMTRFLLPQSVSIYLCFVGILHQKLATLTFSLIISSSITSLKASGQYVGDPKDFLCPWWWGFSFHSWLPQPYSQKTCFILGYMPDYILSKIPCVPCLYLYHSFIPVVCTAQFKCSS